MRMKVFLRKLLRITLPSIVIFLLLFEIALRVSGVVYARYHQPESYSASPSAKENGLNILCVGDSFTFGLGTSAENSYPAQLERLLRGKNLLGVRVINGGRLGFTSSLLLKNVQADINRYRPAVIIVLIGMNNYWNLKDSSYFLLYRDGLSFGERLDSLVGGFRVYKMLKIGWLNFKSKTKKSKDNISAITAKITDISAIDRELAEGHGDSALEKLQEISLREKNNYWAHLTLAYIWNSKKNFGLAKKELWLAIHFVDAWDENFLDQVLVRVSQFDDAVINRENELINLKAYLQDRLAETQRKKFCSIIDARISFLKHHAVFEHVLAYDLKETIRLAKKNHVAVVLQTYPGWADNDIIRSACSARHTPLVDNESAFRERSKYRTTTDLFVPDGHCTAYGYGIIAENVYRALVEHNFIRSS
jgi:lysophospholipase L1-like esterase